MIIAAALAATALTCHGSGWTARDRSIPITRPDASEAERFSARVEGFAGEAVVRTGPRPWILPPRRIADPPVALQIAIVRDDEDRMTGTAVRDGGVMRIDLDRTTGVLKLDAPDASYRAKCRSAAGSTAD